MHGQGRNGKSYHDAWIKLAEQQRFLLLTPEFSDETYPSEAMYQQGFLRAGGELRDKQKWSLMAIEHLFDHVVRENSLAAKRYIIYGHSGGGQFVHRLVQLCPEARIELAIAANPGWYTMPDLNVAYPYGLKGTPTGSDQLKTVFAKRLVVLLGENDKDPNHSSLRRTPAAMRQGAHRFERGHSFFEQAKVMAGKLGVEFNWELITVPGAGHQNSKMAPAAAAEIRKSRSATNRVRGGISQPRPTKATSK
jgi:poly(3-hydroxybutyrate) depolymerase